MVGRQKTSAHYLGRAIRSLRAEAEDQTLDHVARAAGCSKSHLSHIERGEAACTFDLAERLASALGADLDELVRRFKIIRERGPGTKDIVAATDAA